MTLLPENRNVLARRADESLSRHRRGPTGLCEWRLREWRQRVAYPCEFVAIAIGVKDMCRDPHTDDEGAPG